MDPSSPRVVPLLRGLAGLWLVLSCGAQPPDAKQHAAPAAQPDAAAPSPQVIEAPAVPASVTHTLAPGETLWDLARIYGLSTEQIMAQNGLAEADTRKLRPGRALTLTGVARMSTPTPTAPKTAPPEPPSGAAVHYLRPGESLWALARLYDVSLDALMLQNGFDEDVHGRLQIGQGIAIPGVAASQIQSSTKLSAREPTAAVRGIEHEIRRGETVWDIARGYGVSVAEIMAANGLTAEKVESVREGLKLFLPGRERDASGKVRRAPTQRSKRAAELAEQLGLGSLRAAGKLLHGQVEPRWIAAAGGGQGLVGTLRWPVAQGWFVRGFGSGQGGYHKAMDIMGKTGWNVRAAAPGIVGYSGDRVPGFGNMVMVVHPGGWVTLYAHNSVNFVTAGERVQQGSVLAEVGSTGRSTGPHVHFELIYQGENCDPAPLFRPGVRHRSGKLSALTAVSWKAPNKRPKTVLCAVRQKHPEPIQSEDPLRDVAPVDERELRDPAPDTPFANLLRELTAAQPANERTPPPSAN
ncbi:MAG: LysM peptidoglycan-binding domain-containing protein [Polyangiales bacterium]